MYTVKASIKICFYQLLIHFTLETAALIESRLPLGVDDFCTIISQNLTYADKTELAKDIINDDSQVILITRPRLFGKSVSMSMLRYFFENMGSNPIVVTRDIFTGLKISEDKTFCAAHRNQYPVIHMTFKDLGKTDWKKAESYIFKLIGGVYEHHSYLLDESVLNTSEKQTYALIRNETAPVADVRMAIINLCKYLNLNFKKKVILLIDEVEKIFRTAYLNGYYEQMHSLISGMILPCLLGNQYALKTVMTGMSVIGHAGIITSAGNVKVYAIMDDERYGRYFGFTTDDIHYLLEETGLRTKSNELDEWYKGYNVSGIDIYNPWSTIMYLNKNGKPGFYWVKTADTELVVKQVAAMGIATTSSFEKLLRNQTVVKHVFNDEKSIINQALEPLWSLLVHTGYMSATPNPGTGDSTLYTLRIPNKEIKDELTSLYRSINKTISAISEVYNPNSKPK